MGVVLDPHELGGPPFAGLVVDPTHPHQVGLWNKYIGEARASGDRAKLAELQQQEAVVEELPEEP